MKNSRHLPSIRRREATEPGATGSGATRPEDARPEDARPEDARPEDTRAEDTRAEDARPEDTRAEDTRAEDARQALPGEVAELVGELSETGAPSRPRRATAAISRVAGRGGRASWHGATSGGRWLTSQVLAMAPRIPVRDQQALHAQFPDLGTEQLADALIQGAARSAAAVGASVGMAMVLPLPAAPVEIAVETLALVGIEVKLVAELHEVYGMRAPGSTTERMLAYVVAWAHRRGVSFGPAGLALVVGSPLRRRLQRRLIARAGRSALSLGPLMSGAVAGAALNRRETRRLGQGVRNDLRRRSPYRSG